MAVEENVGEGRYILWILIGITSKSGLSRQFFHLSIQSIVPESADVSIFIDHVALQDLSGS